MRSGRRRGVTDVQSNCHSVAVRVCGQKRLDVAIDGKKYPLGGTTRLRRCYLSKQSCLQSLDSEQSRKRFFLSAK